MWLGASWGTFVETNSRHVGKLSLYMNELQRADRERVFVPTRKLRGGSPSNPFLGDAPSSTGYHCEVEPRAVADKLMSVREEKAALWRDELRRVRELRELKGSSGGATAERRPSDQQLLIGMATRAALRELLRELSLRPSQSANHVWLSDFLLHHSAEMEADGDVEGMLASLEAQPILIRGATLRDPMALADEVRKRSGSIQEEMARHLDDTTFEHLSLRSSFLETCFKLQGEDDFMP